jgi:hypothetical protein
MTRRRDNHNATAWPDQAGETVHEHKMPEMVDAELGCEAIFGASEGSSHDTGVGDDDVEWLANRQQRGGAPAHTGQRRLSEPCRHSDEAVTIILCRTILSRSNR